MKGPTGREKPRVALVGEDGNAFFILGRCGKALERAGYPQDEVDRFYKEAQNGDYDNLLRVVMEWTQEPDEEEE
jgi:hypothetical protein